MVALVIFPAKTGLVSTLCENKYPFNSFNVKLTLSLIVMENQTMPVHYFASASGKIKYSSNFFKCFLTNLKISFFFQ